MFKFKTIDTCSIWYYRMFGKQDNINKTYIMNIDIDQKELLVPHTYKVFEKDFNGKKTLEKISSLL